MRYYCCITLSSSRKTNASSRRSKKDFWRRSGEVFAQVKTYQVPVTNSSPSHLHYLPFASRFSLPHFTLAVLFSLSFPISSSLSFALFRFPFPFACLLDYLFVAMAQDNTKLCDFTNTNNNDFLSTPVAPLTDAESCEINAALLNLVMKNPFSGLPSEDVASHLNNFVDLCDMQKKKDVDNDIVKLKLFPFPLRDRAKAWFRLCLKIVLILGTSARMLLSLCIFLPLRLSLLGTIL